MDNLSSVTQFHTALKKRGDDFVPAKWSIKYLLDKYAVPIPYRKGFLSYYYMANRGWGYNS